MGLKICLGSFGVTGVKNVNHMKNMKTAPISKLLCHLVDNSQSFQKVNGNLIIRPHLKGSKIKIGHIFKIFKMLFLI